MPVVGAIADAAQSLLPVTWTELEKAEEFGDGLLQGVVDTVKEELFGTPIPTPDQEDDFPLRVIRFAGLCVALDLIPPGIDLWMNQPNSESASGVDENHTWVNRANELRLLEERLMARKNREEAGIMILLGRPRVRHIPRASISTGDEPLLTPSPSRFPRPFAEER